MPGIDLLISRVLTKEIKKNLDENILKLIEKKLFFEHGMSIKLSIEHFDKFHDALKKYFDNDIELFEKKCIQKIIRVKKSNSNYIVEIINPELAEKIIDFYGDSESRKILMSIMGNSLTVSEILKKSQVLKSPLYRKTETLLLNGLIIESGKILKNKKRVSKYECVFDKVNLSILKDQFSVECIVNGKKFNESSISKLGLFEE